MTSWRTCGLRWTRWTRDAFRRIDLDPMRLSEIEFDDRGLVPVVTQDADSGEVLTLAYADHEAVQRTLETREAHYWSRSRAELWRKGATSGNVQDVVEVRLDCDGDALVYRVRPRGPACHTGERTCFHRSIGSGAEPSLGQVMTLLERVVDDRLTSLPEGSYVTSLHRRGVGYMAQKVVEEAGESIVAALQGEHDALTEEAGDLLFHLTVLLRASGVSLGDVGARLWERHRVKTAE